MPKVKQVQLSGYKPIHLLIIGQKLLTDVYRNPRLFVGMNELIHKTCICNLMRWKSFSQYLVKIIHIKKAHGVKFSNLDDMP